MATRFWLGLFMLPDGFDIRQLPEVPSDTKGPFAVVVDVLHKCDGDGARADAAVLLSLVGEAGQGAVRCLMGFTNATAWSDQLRQSGFTLFESRIHLRESGGGRWSLEVEPPSDLHIDADPDQGGALPSAPSVTVAGIRFDSQDAPRRAAEQLVPMHFSQQARAPDPADVVNRLSYRPVEVEVPRLGIASLPLGAELTLTFPDGRRPSGSLPKSSQGSFKEWCGRLVRDIDHGPRTKASIPGRPPLRKRSDAPATSQPGFRFEDVELVGLRIDLRHHGKTADVVLDRLIEPLNFQLREASNAGGRTSFKYQAAARAVSLEVLRYGRMYLNDRPPDEGPEVFVSQYELLVRILVGRVDDDSAQGREPAMFVPAIFVDSGLSRMVGREQQGYGKALARFVNRFGREMQQPEPDEPPGSRLFEIGKVQQIDRLGADEAVGAVDIVAFDLPPIPSGWERRALSPLTASSRFRQRDFHAREFRRSFARETLGDGLDRFRSLQVTPVDKRELPSAWIPTTFAFRDLRAALPTGIASFKLAKGKLPEALRSLRDLIGDEWIGLPTGEWYVGRCSIDVRLENPLA